MNRLPRFFLQVFLVCFASLLLEISYTRIFSFKFFYYFAYMVIGFALLGLGSGGVAVAVSRRLKEAAEDTVVATCCLAGGLSIALGYVVVASTATDTLSLWNSWAEVGRFGMVCSCLFVNFFFVGVILSTIFGRSPKEVGRLYAVDLIGAAMACAVVVPLMKTITPIGVVFLAAALFLIAGIFLLRARSSAMMWPSAVAAGLFLVVAARPSLAPTILTDDLKYLHPAKVQPADVLFTRWSPVFRLDVLRVPEFGDDRLIIGHDGMLGSTLHKFDGDLTKLSRLDRDPRVFPFTLSRSAPEVLVIGSAGGHELLASLYYGANHVTGVELNPETVALLTTHFSDYTGHLAENPRVTVLNDEGRSFLASSEASWDIIYFVAPDSYAAMNAAASGAFVLSESYLYTKETVQESIRRLSDDGILCMQFGEFSYDRKPNRTVRYLATARAALREMGIEDFANHVLVVTVPDFVPLSTVLISKQPFTPERMERFLARAAAIPGAVVRHAPGKAREDGPVNTMIESAEGESDPRILAYPYEVSAVTDNKPFFWHFSRFRDVLFGGDSSKGDAIDLEDAVGERILGFMLAFSAVFAAVALLVPFVTIRQVWKELPCKLRSGVYFACLGLGFLFFEIALIQKLTLFLGYPTYSLTVTLFAMLLFTGLGALRSERHVENPGAAATTVLGAITVITLGYLFVLPLVVNGLVGTHLAVRVAVAILAIAPLGFCLGMFMPMGLAAVARLTRYPEEYVAWGWAVNGFFSVVSSVLSTLLSMTYGFNTVLLLALGVYGIAVVMLKSIGAEQRA